MSTYKKIDLFGNEQVFIAPTNRKKKTLFADHDAFVEKFEAKKTTDDCYTPENVFLVILNHINEKYSLDGKTILRPFYPGGDFEAIDYPENCVVIDNPPFSIISKIVKFYIGKNIPFFLFAPHLTLFSSNIDCTHIVAAADIIYENGAVIKTSFLSNMFGDKKVIGDADLYRKIKDVQKIGKVSLPTYKYPANVLTVSMVAYMVEKGVSISIDKAHAKHWRALQSQKAQGKAIFGSGFLISNSAAAEKAAAEKAAAEKAAAESFHIFEWELSAKELEIIASLGQKNNT